MQCLTNEGLRVVIVINSIQSMPFIPELKVTPRKDEKKFSTWVSEFNRSSPIPLYHQIENIIERAIRVGTLKPHEKTPTEHELCRIFGVSRSVVRQALKGIEDKGLVVRSPGRGTFVAEKKFSFRSLQGLKGFFQDVETAGSLPSSKILKKEFTLASGKISQALSIPDGSPVLFINRLRFIDDVPFLISRTYLAITRISKEFQEEDFENQSLYALLEEKYGYEISYSQRFLEATHASQGEAKLLTINPGDSIVLTRSITCFQDGTPFEYDIGLHRGDRARFEINVFRNSEEKLKLVLTK